MQPRCQPKQRFSIQRGPASIHPTASHYHPSARTTLLTSPSKAQVDDGLHLTCLGSSLPRARARFLRIRHLPASTCIDSNPSTRASLPKFAPVKSKLCHPFRRAAPSCLITRPRQKQKTRLDFCFSLHSSPQVSVPGEKLSPLPSFRLASSWLFLRLCCCRRLPESSPVCTCRSLAASVASVPRPVVTKTASVPGCIRPSFHPTFDSLASFREPVQRLTDCSVRAKQAGTSPKAEPKGFIHSILPRLHRIILDDACALSLALALLANWF